MQAIIYALIAYFAWGIGITFEAIAARKIESKSFSFWGFFLAFIITSFFAPSALSKTNNVSLELVGICYIIAFFMIVGAICYYEALKKGNPSLVGTIGSSFPFVTVVLSLIFLKEKITVYQILAIIVIFFGLTLSTLDINQLKKRRLVLNAGVFLALITMLCWGIYSTLIKIPINKIGWFLPNWIIFSSFPLVYLYIKITKTKLDIPKRQDALIPVVLSIVFVRTAEFAYNLGLSKGMASVVAPIAGANPTLFVLLAYFIFKEPLKKTQIIGIVTTLIGVILLSTLSV